MGHVTNEPPRTGGVTKVLASQRLDGASAIHSAPPQPRTVVKGQGKSQTLWSELRSDLSPCRISLSQTHTADEKHESQGGLEYTCSYTVT